MATKELEKSRWEDAFNGLSKALIGKRAELEVASLALGDQIEAEWVPFLGISYDPKRDTIEILLQGIDHSIRRPRKVYLDEGATGLASMEIIDGEDARQILKLRDALMLPARGKSESDPTEEQSRESFPASDAPSRTPITRAGAPKMPPPSRRQAPRPKG